MKNFIFFIGLFSLIYSSHASAWGGWLLKDGAATSIMHAPEFIKNALGSKPEPTKKPHKTIAENKTFEADTLSVSMKNINDLGFVFVVDRNDNVNLASQSGAWTLGVAGSAEAVLDDYLENNTASLIVFVLWNEDGKTIENRFFKKTLLDSWSYDFSVYGDGTNLFHESYEGSGAQGVAYYVAFSAVRIDKRILIKPASKAQTARLTPAFLKINNDLKKHKAPEGSADIAAALSVAISTKITRPTQNEEFRLSESEEEPAEQPEPEIRREDLPDWNSYK